MPKTDAAFFLLYDTAPYFTIHEICEKMKHVYLQLLFTPGPRTSQETPSARYVAAGEHDSGGSWGFAKRTFMPKLRVTGHTALCMYCKVRKKMMCQL